MAQNEWGGTCVEDTHGWLAQLVRKQSYYWPGDQLNPLVAFYLWSDPRLKLPAHISPKQPLDKGMSLFVMGIKWQNVDGSVKSQSTVEKRVPCTLGMEISNCFMHEEKQYLSMVQFIFEIFLWCMKWQSIFINYFAYPLLSEVLFEKSLTNLIFTEWIV